MRMMTARLLTIAACIALQPAAFAQVGVKPEASNMRLVGYGR
jgi:hypothetical protein